MHCQYPFLVGGCHWHCPDCTILFSANVFPPLLFCQSISNRRKSCVFSSGFPCQPAATINKSLIMIGIAGSEVIQNCQTPWLECTKVQTLQIDSFIHSFSKKSRFDKSHWWIQLNPAESIWRHPTRANLHVLIQWMDLKVYLGSAFHIHSNIQNKSNEFAHLSLHEVDSFYSIFIFKRAGSFLWSHVAMICKSAFLLISGRNKQTWPFERIE